MNLYIKYIQQMKLINIFGKIYIRYVLLETNRDIEFLKNIKVSIKY